MRRAYSTVMAGLLAAVCATTAPAMPAGATQLAGATQRAGAAQLAGAAQRADATQAAGAIGGDGTRWTWPLHPAPRVVRGFEPPASPWGSGHRGVDLAGHVGQPVHSAGAGVVSYAAPLAGRGVVVVRHGDLRTTYEPVRAGVEVGETVATGDTIGTLELTASHCLPAACLHWGLLRGEVYLDPLSLLGAGPVRLLPLHGHGGVADAAAGAPWRHPSSSRRGAGVALTEPAASGVPIGGLAAAGFPAVALLPLALTTVASGLAG